MAPAGDGYIAFVVHRFPLKVCEGEAIEPQDPPRNAKELCLFLSAKENGAGVARAGDLSRLAIKQMLVLRREFEPA
jgi:hypothetical protein